MSSRLASAPGTSARVWRSLSEVLVMNWLKNLLTKQTFKAGDQVNLAPAGMVQRFDGCVLAETSSGVLVEWPRHGLRLESRKELALIAA